MAFRKLHDNIAVGTICLAVGFSVLGKADTSRAADLPNVGFRTGPGEVCVTMAGKPVAAYIHADDKIRRPYFAHVKMTLMCHPENFRLSWMHARDYGFIAANPFGRKALTGKSPSRVSVGPGEELRLRYGVLLHDDPLDLNAAYEDYVQLSQEG